MALLLTHEDVRTVVDMADAITAMEAAFLEEGTLAGSTLTMDRAFRTLVARCGSSIVEAATMCSTTPARELGLTGFGVIAIGAAADLTVLDRGFRVVRTFIAGEQVAGPAAVQ